jgi:hypothetical protein
MARPTHNGSHRDRLLVHHPEQDTALPKLTLHGVSLQRRVVGCCLARKLHHPSNKDLHILEYRQPRMPWRAGVYWPFAQSQDSPHTWISKRCSKLDGTPAEPRGCLVRPLDDSIVERQRRLGQLATLLFIRVANNDGPTLRGPNRALGGFYCPRPSGPRAACCAELHWLPTPQDGDPGTLTSRLDSPWSGLTRLGSFTSSPP